MRMPDLKQFYVLTGMIIVLLGVSSIASAQDTSVQIIDIDEDAFQKDTVPRSVPVNRVLAVVDEQVITMADYQAKYGDTVLTYGRLKPMIDQLLLLATANDREISIPGNRLDQLVEKQITRINRRPGGLQTILRRRGLTKEQFRTQLRRRIRTQFLESRVLADEFPEIRNQDTQPAYVSVRARLMMVDDLSEAWRIYRWLQTQPAQTTWNQLYDKYARKMSLLGENGDLGWFTWGQFNQKIEYRVFKLPLYAVSQPFQLRDGYALVYPIGYRLEPTVPEPSQAFKVYQGYRRRFLREKLYERLRRRISVVIPTSVRDRLND
jgi:parvulin-like peptidyl-prolyl isomerase